MMETYKFETTVLKNGIIQLPGISKFVDYPVEVFIVVKQPNEQADTPEKQTIDQFLGKWTGILRGCKPDDSKRQYLTEKYQ
uniref:Uncharacterized protein n=1 Tax=Candidatus Kentrum sp. FM TaxID=2126340 RepID=A0A450WE12_9GAMM|nr:MAG: hypothetical protein BECKFM1743A_GA0114220_103662 [Candidatus Kentron sp. FM]VFJ65188.1 MAG: hypothetical protein BECKFM1743C_GA0114222_103883 [Candidatus Kentron sp. FM]VFK15283.1 MAG: hypothetical protein BECKFM1743B_GA0114221_103642 [Candidatus Kentron sp. FM]